MPLVLLILLFYFSAFHCTSHEIPSHCSLHFAHHRYGSRHTDREIPRHVFRVATHLPHRVVCPALGSFGDSKRDADDKE